jgi:hypothetical protein
MLNLMATNAAVASKWVLGTPLHCQDVFQESTTEVPKEQAKHSREN